jgi:hypothetical protein
MLTAGAKTDGPSGNFGSFLQFEQKSIKEKKKKLRE